MRRLSCLKKITNIFLSQAFVVFYSVLETIRRQPYEYRLLLIVKVNPCFVIVNQLTFLCFHSELIKKFANFKSYPTKYHEPTSTVISVYTQSNAFVAIVNIKGKKRFQQ